MSASPTSISETLKTYAMPSTTSRESSSSTRQLSWNRSMKAAPPPPRAEMATSSREAAAAAAGAAPSLHLRPRVTEGPMAAEEIAAEAAAATPERAPTHQVDIEADLLWNGADMTITTEVDTTTIAASLETTLTNANEISVTGTITTATTE